MHVLMQALKLKNVNSLIALVLKHVDMKVGLVMVTVMMVLLVCTLIVQPSTVMQVTV